jgi:hypothetical protein
MQQPIKNCYWVVAGKLLAGEYPLCVRIVFASKKLFNPMGEARYETAKKVFRRVQGGDNQKDDATSSGNCFKII